MPAVKANMNAAARAIMHLFIMEASWASKGHAGYMVVYSTAAVMAVIDLGNHLAPAYLSACSARNRYAKAESV